MCSFTELILSCIGKCQQGIPEHISVTCSPKINNCCSTNEEKLTEIPIKYNEDITLYYNTTYRHFTLYQSDYLELRADNIKEVTSFINEVEKSRISKNEWVQESSV